jgi:transposase InsO family protein
MDRPRGAGGSKLPELTKRTILLLKSGDPTLGCQRISDMLARGPALGASPPVVARVLKEAGYELEEVATRPHRDHVRRFEREKANQLWQTDLFTFVLKRQNRRVYLVGFMDDHSRFIVGFGLHARQSTALVLEALRSSITNYGVPEEILTDNGSQYVTWRGQSAFSKELAGKGIRHIVAKPRRPQTLGKIERFWGTFWRECAESAVFVDLEDARQRVAHFIDHYNFHRPHQGLEGLTPADRYFTAAPQVREMQKARIAENALELARHGVPKQPLYITGQSGGRSFSVHSEGDRVFLTRDGEPRQEVDLTPPEEPAPGTSPLDDALAELRAQMAGRDEEESS